MERKVGARVSIYGLVDFMGNTGKIDSGLGLLQYISSIHASKYVSTHPRAPDLELGHVVGLLDLDGLGILPVD